jgi:DNA-binding protein H-NS
MRPYSAREQVEMLQQLVSQVRQQQQQQHAELARTKADHELTLNQHEELLDQLALRAELAGAEKLLQAVIHESRHASRRRAANLICSS